MTCICRCIDDTKGNVSARLRFYLPFAFVFCVQYDASVATEDGEFEDGFPLTAGGNDREIGIITGEDMSNAVRRES